MRNELNKETDTIRKIEEPKNKSINKDSKKISAFEQKLRDKYKNKINPDSENKNLSKKEIDQKLKLSGKFG